MGQRREMTDKFPVNIVLRQGCHVLQTFKIYVEAALKQWGRKIRAVGIELSTLQYADHQAVISNVD